VVGTDGTVGRNMMEGTVAEGNGIQGEKRVGGACHRPNCAPRTGRGSGGAHRHSLWQREVGRKEARRKTSQPLTFDLLRIRRTRIMRTDLLRRRALVEAHEQVQEVVARRVVVVPTIVVGEVVALRGNAGTLVYHR
jgi:hypothetical protein